MRHHRSPDDITYLINTAAVYYEQGALEACIDACTRAVAKGREVFSPLALIAKAFARIGNAHAKVRGIEEGTGIGETLVLVVYSSPTLQPDAHCNISTGRRPEVRH